MAEESNDFNKQYENIIAANNISSNPNASKEDLVAQAKENYKIADNASTNFLQSIIKKNKEHYDGGGSLNSNFRDVAQEVPRDIYKKILKINSIKEKTPKDKNKRADLYARLETWKRERVSDKANVKIVVDAVSSDLVNYELMDTEYKALLAQVINRDGDLNKKGIKLFNRKSDDKLMVSYTGNRMGKEYVYNKEMESGTTENLEDQSTPQTISFEGLMRGVHHKQLDAETKVYDTVTGQANAASEMNKKLGSFQTPSWNQGINSGESKVRKALMPVIKGKMVIADLSTRDIFGKGSTYRDDLSGLVGGMDLSKMGLIDKGVPGYEDDLANDALVKEEIIGRLINPKSSDDEKFAEESMLEYFTLLAGQSFNNKRNEIVKDDPGQQELLKKSTISKMTPQEIIKKFSK
tara:strand:- start:348 stop:1571 length:1224 start_codon:yes stop_codon:yes gene_type:complete